MSVSNLYPQQTTLADFIFVNLQTFANTLYGHVGSITYTVGIALSALGAVNANVFAVSRLVVSAAQRSYLPSFLSGNDRADLNEDEASDLSVGREAIWPSWFASCTGKIARMTAGLRLKEKRSNVRTPLVLPTSPHINFSVFRLGQIANVHFP